MTEMPPQGCLKRDSGICLKIKEETEIEKVVMVDGHGIGTGSTSMTRAEKGIVKETGARKEIGSGATAGKGRKNTVRRGIAVEAESLTETEMEMETRGETGIEIETETAAGREIKSEKTMTETEQRTETETEKETVTEIETAGTREENAQGVVNENENVEKIVTEEIVTENVTKTEARRKAEIDGAGARKRKMTKNKDLTAQGQSLQNLKIHHEGHSS